MKGRSIFLLFLLVYGALRVSSPAQSVVPYSLYTIAETYRRNGRYLEALSFYRDISLNKWDTAASLYKNAGDIYYEFLENDEHALKMYTMIGEKYPGALCAPEVHLRMARILFRKGLRETALKHYRTITSSYPEYARDNRVTEEMEKAEKGEGTGDNTTLSAGQSFPQQVRVLLKDDAAPVVLSSPGGLELYSPPLSARVNVVSGETVQCRADGDSIYVEKYGKMKSPVRIESRGSTDIVADNKTYRGLLWAHVKDGHLVLVNHLRLEEYLYSVLSHEVPSSWPASALQAQAIAARTYALYHMVKRKHELYDLLATTASQVYGGKKKENASYITAVDQTRGRVLTYDKKIAYTLYHSNSGGETAETETIWGWRVPYLERRQDAFSIDTRGFNWEQTLRADDIGERLKNYGFPATAVQTITLVEKDCSGRINTLHIDTGNGSFYVSGNSFRLIAGPGRIKSLYFTVERKKQMFIFKGKGYGHGAGMSQWGACQMAHRGYACEQILQFYYPGTVLMKIQSIN
ncbi:MAG: SpoIID/LytB domain-containing protein [Proteobacteria bacterium]|nr:SpoIID/LytB domain-containing protein [Pseudomonadota bacterium]